MLRDERMHGQGGDERGVSAATARADFVFKVFWSYAAYSATGALLQ